MRTLATKEIKIASITNLPGDWRKRLSLPRVKKLARSIDELMLLNEPVVRKKGMRYLCGADRLAALSVLGREKALVKLVECTDEEAAQVTEDENAMRRNEVVEVTPRLERAKEKIAEQNPEIPMGGAGRRKTAAGLAVDAVAKEQGILPGSVRNKAWREKKRAERAEAPGELIVSFGMELDAPFVEQVMLLQGHLDEAGGLLTRAQALLTQAAKLPGSARLQHLRDSIAEAASAIRGLVPTMLCPYCKGTKVVQDECAACETSAVIGKSKEQGVPPALLDTENLQVLFRGNIVSLMSFYPDEPAEADDAFADESEAAEDDLLAGLE